MGTEQRYICLLIDNFSGHKIPFTPRNIQIVFFEPNLTSFVQPLDAGIIRCFKAYYRRQFCLRAIDLDEAGNSNIWKITLREAMVMATQAWSAITPTTIQHCWNHTGIQAATAPLSHPAHADPGAWAIIREFATSEMPLPLVETALQQHLGSRYIASDWSPSLKAVMDAEGDAAQATEAVEKLALATCTRSGLILKISVPKPPQLEALEDSLKGSISILKDRNRIFGTPLSVNELLDPLEERENLDLEAEVFDDDAAIIAEVRRREAVRNGDAIEVDSDDEDDLDEAKPATTFELIALVEKLEAGYLSRIGADSSPDFLHHLRAFRAELRHDQMKSAKQTTLISQGFVKRT